VAEARAAFDKQRDLEYSITSITGKDLLITKENDKVVIGFAYDKLDPDLRPGVHAHQVRGAVQIAAMPATEEGTPVAGPATTPGLPLSSLACCSVR
jgi:arginase family enzyme